MIDMIEKIIIKKSFVLIIVFTVFLIALSSGKVFLFSKDKEAEFERLTVEEMHKRIIQERDIAISKSKKEGKYKKVQFV